MFTTDPEKWVIKGGFALILRLDPSRTSNDVDATYVAQAGEHALAVAALERAVATDLDDFFAFEIVGEGEESDDHARRVSIRCRLGAREFARFRVDLSVPEPNVPYEEITAPPLSGVPEVDDLPLIRALAWPQQIADKTCAVFEIRGNQRSSRSRDLADLGMIARQVDGLQGSGLTAALRAEERRRTHTLPVGLPKRFELDQEQEAAWRAAFPRASRGAPIHFDEALELAQALIDPLLDGSAAGKVWATRSRAYVLRKRA